MSKRSVRISRRNSLRLSIAGIFGLRELFDREQEMYEVG